MTQPDVAFAEFVMDELDAEAAMNKVIEGLLEKSTKSHLAKAVQGRKAPNRDR